ncbi:MAG: dihydrodipicolinate synthase family protein [Deltaproteobacteria bacterium]|nr:MAG: dihydrodipicolinate synthase family protein [Deltaproteobacteria bacterium]
MSSNEIRGGVFPVVPTPLKDDETLDEAGLSHLLNFYLDSGCHGLVVLGSGGEYPYFTFEEKLQIIKATLKEINRRVPVITGAGFYSLAEAIKFIKAADELGIDGFLIALPTYYKINFPDALNFFSHICQNTEKAVLYYHFPQITGLGFTPEQISRLLSLDGISGAKESSLSISEMRTHLRSVKKENFILFSGTSFLLIEALALGGHGVICPIPSIAPRLVVDCLNAWQDKNKDRALKLQEKILEFLPIMNSFDLPVGIQKAGLKIISRLPLSKKTGARSRHAVVKEALRQLGHPISPKVRSPLPQITEGEKRAIAKLLGSLNISGKLGA